MNSGTFALVLFAAWLFGALLLQPSTPD